MAGSRFTRDDWLILGLAQLSAHGPEGLRLEALCDAAARTRGSFYHHFPDQDDFVAALLDHWREWTTDGVMEMVAMEVELSGQRSRIKALISGLDHQLEAALRRFAAIDQNAAQAVADVDQSRIAFLADMNEQEFGVAPDSAATLAVVEYAAFLGFQQLNPNADDAEISKFSGTLEDMILGAV